jgi:predicted RNA-binding protein YlxR (DUF448 family)
MDKKIKKAPERQCMGCNGHFPKKDLLRVVKSPDGEVSLDFTGKKSGRGAYICQNPACLAKAERSKRLSRALSCEIPAEVYAAMHDELCAATDKA